MEDPSLRAWFNAVDTDRGGTVDARELQQAFNSANMHFSLHACAMLIRIYDTSRTGQVNFQQFCALHNFIVTVQRSFLEFDGDRNGVLDAHEVSLALQRNGFVLDPPAFRSLMVAFDPERRGVLRMDDYIQMASFLSSAKSMFAAFDPHGTGTIHLNFSQFVYASSHLR
ncbi:Penta-EF hand domain-containing protein 2 [Porphyridium purpureum]|uniref:Penta-EF hand domain-containing protein 2 n=1 Tax=Porphyridium purpureum TaxID=35688 RepID=A0A5J4YUW9_PORPP|nr:Penta-EF hand domain-containing protein 2 [Porphyridium purpureum]|eukprot:POR5167..scf209_3